jgi:hypothetical protein
VAGGRNDGCNRFFINQFRSYFKDKTIHTYVGRYPNEKMTKQQRPKIGANFDPRVPRVQGVINSTLVPQGVNFVPWG